MGSKKKKKATKSDVEEKQKKGSTSHPAKSDFEEFLADLVTPLAKGAVENKGKGVADEPCVVAASPSLLPHSGPTDLEQVMGSNPSPTAQAQTARKVFDETLETEFHSEQQVFDRNPKRVRFERRNAQEGDEAHKRGSKTKQIWNQNLGRFMFAFEDW